MKAPFPARAISTCVLLVTLLVVSACKEEGGVRVSSMKFNGVGAVTADQLKSVLATGASSRLPWGEKRYFSREQFEADLKRIAAFYHDRGFPDARVTSFDVKLSSDQSSVDIVLDISEGEPIVAERLELNGFDVLPPRQRMWLDRSLAIRAGQPMDRALMQSSRESALDRLKDNGYPYASVRLTERPGSSERQRILTLTAEPGPLTRHGEVEIQGNSSVGDKVILRQLTFQPGDVFRQSKMLESQRKLYALEVFQFANVQPLRTEGDQPVDIPTRITVTEGKHRKVNFSVGYGTEEKGRVEADWRHVNFFGGARTAGVRARYSGLDRGVKLSFGQPYLFTPKLSFGLQGQYWHNDEPQLYRLDNVGGRATITREFGRAGGGRFSASRPASTLSLTYANEYEDYEISNELLTDLTFRDELISLGLDPRTGLGTGHRSSLSLDAGRNTTNNVLDASRGYMATIHLEQAGKWLGGNYDYYEITGEGRYFIPITPNVVFAVRARAGSIKAIGTSPASGETPEEALVPFHKRYFLGGATNLRGWGRYDVSPLSGSGLPIGGHSFANFSTEIRVPIWGKLGGVLFVDGGNVWTESWNLNLSDMRYDAGPGLRYDTPIGPIRADVGFQLNRIPGLLVNGRPEPRQFRFHFSIGQAF
jgi:outer membrane protein assembly complex protein YaeT